MKVSFEKLKFGLQKTRKNILGKLVSRVGLYKKIDEELLEELEEILIRADVGVDTTQKIIQGLRDKAKNQGANQASQLTWLLKNEISAILENSNPPRSVNLPPSISDVSPYVIMVVGVNGTGKTTSIGKLAKKYSDEGKKVLVAACDTFRAAAIDQLEIWAKKAGVDMVKSQPEADPASVAFDAIKAAQAREIDVVIVDTAGRLHTKLNLMEELKKIKKVMGKSQSGTPHQILLVMDATTGQNGISQAKLFQQAVGVDGIILAKLDGTAKGGIVIAISDELRIPVKYVGLGEKLDDLQEFSPVDFVEALFT